MTRKRRTATGRAAGRLRPVIAIGLFAVACGSAELADPQFVSTSTAGAFEAALAVLPDRLIVAWYDTRDGNGEIYFRAVTDPEVPPSEPERRITWSTAESYEASIDAVGAQVAVAWYDKIDRGLEAKVGIWTADGARIWSHSLGARSRNPVVRGTTDRLFCAWIQADAAGQESVWAGWWDQHGHVIQPSRRLAPAGSTTWNLNAAIDPHGVGWVAFDAVAGTKTNEIYLVVAGHEPSPPTRLTTDDGQKSTYPDLAFDNGRLAITWFDRRDGNTEVYLAVTKVGELDEPLDRLGTRVTATRGESVGAYLAWNDGRIGLAWSDDSEGQHEIYFQSFDRDGTPMGEAQRVTTTGPASLIPAIRPWETGFVLAWNEYVGSEQEHDDRSRSGIAVARVE